MVVEITGRVIPDEFWNMDYGSIPPFVLTAMRDYVLDSKRPDRFLQAVICNDLHQSCSLADPDLRRELHNITKWFFNVAPADCWGSEEKMEEWLRRT